jgi:hypothetical protein
MDARLVPLLIPLAFIGSNLAMAGPAEDATVLCDAYASAAITTVQLAKWVCAARPRALGSLL